MIIASEKQRMKTTPLLHHLFFRLYSWNFPNTCIIISFVVKIFCLPFTDNPADSLYAKLIQKLFRMYLFCVAVTFTSSPVLRLLHPIYSFKMFLLMLVVSMMFEDWFVLCDRCMVYLQLYIQ